MSALSNHYGVDASIDAAQITEISAWLAREAGTSRQGPPPDDRITRSA